MNETSKIKNSVARLRSPSDLIEAGLISDAARPAMEAVSARYAIALTPEMASLIDPSDPADPIARQFIPSVQELERREEETGDPIGDRPHTPVKGLVHRYRDRVLLKPLHTCPVYCRFCFRREMVGPDGDGILSDAELADAFAYVEAREEIFEVIISGGDPFMMSPRRMSAIAQAVGRIAHVRVMRWHTRVPLVDPSLVNDDLIAALKTFSGAIYVAVHANHPREFASVGCAAVARLADAGIVLLSQTVLLKGVNDNAAIMEELMRTFVANRVHPYYLHHGDLAPGTGHFRTSIEDGQLLMRALRGRLSGIAQPTYVVDLPGGHGKVPIGPVYQDGETIADPSGEWHAYPPKGSSI